MFLWECLSFLEAIFIKNRPHTKKDSRRDRLSAENKSLRAELASLKAQNTHLTALLKSRIYEHDKEIGNIPDTVRTDEKIQHEFTDMAQKNRAMSSKSYPSYLLSRLRGNGVYGYARKWFDYFRRIRFASFVITFISYISSVIIQTSTFVIFASVYTVFLLPAMLISAPVIMLGGFFGSKRSCNIIEKELRDKKRIFVFFPERVSQFSADSFFRKNIESLASDEDCAIIIVSPKAVSASGIGKRKLYTTFRREQKNIYLLRKYFYFNFRNDVLSSPKTKERLCLVY